MKRKSIFLFLSVFVLSLCTTLGLVKLGDEEVYAESTTASVWDGTYKSETYGSDYYTEGTEVHILTADGFSYFAKRVADGVTYLNQTIILESDIDLASHEWTPIGTASNSFRGTFDGNGHTIYNLKITNSSTDVGLFGYTTGVVNNLILEDIDINVSGATSVGGLIGNANYQSKTLSNISVSGNIVATNVRYVGGVVGCSQTQLIRNASTILSRVDIETSSMPSNSAVGGIFGSFSVGVGTLEQLAFEGSINSGASYIGGLFGELGSFSTLRNSYVKADMHRTYDINLITTYLGGIVGNINNTLDVNAELYNLYADIYPFILVPIEGEEGAYYMHNNDPENLYQSGLFGNIRNNSQVSFTIKNNLVLVEKVNTKDSSYTFNNFFYNPNGASVTASNNWISADSLDEISDDSILSLEDFYIQQSFYANENYFDQSDEYKWDFEDVWYVDKTMAWNPKLIPLKNIGNPNNDTDYSYEDRLQGDGSAGAPYLIRTAADLGYLSVNYSEDYQDKWFSLENDINLIGKTWQPIGANPSVPFSGVFLGNGHTISGITCSLQYQYSYHGLFGVTEDALICDLTIEDIRFINEGTGDTNNTSDKNGYMGAFVGYAKAGTYLDNCVDNSGVVGLYSVGKVDRNTSRALTIIYGKKNYNGTSTAVNTLKLENVSDYGIGYDVEIDYDGGVLYYGKSFNLTDIANNYTDYISLEHRYGNRMLFLQNSSTGNFFENVRPVSAFNDKNNIYGRVWWWDQFLLAGSLPQSSDLAGYVDLLLIKKGSRVVSYSKVSDGTVVTHNESANFDEGELVSQDYIRFLPGYGVINIDATWLAGIKANYEKMPNKTVEVHYNEYEKTHFGAESDADYLSKTFEVEYDSILWNDYNEIFDRYPTKDGRALLRGEDFYIEDFYLDAEFEERLEGGTNSKGELENMELGKLSKGSFVNNTFFPEDTINLYAKWVGSEDAIYQLKIKFSTVEDIALGNLDLSQAIESVSLSSFDGDNQVLLKSQQEFTVESDGTVIVDFDFNTLYSNLATNGLQLVIKLKTGYEFSQPVSLVDFASGEGGSSYDYSFGHLTIKGESQDTIITSSNTFSQSAFERGISFLNLVGDYQIDVTIQKQSFSTKLNIVPDEIYFSLAPNVGNVTEVAVYEKGMTSDPSTTTPSTTYSINNADGEYVGLDVLNNVLIYSDDMVGANATLGEGLRLGESGFVLFRYTLLDGSTRYFGYVRSESSETVEGILTNYTIYTLQEVEYTNGEWQIVDILASLTLNESGEDYLSVTYLTNAEFVFLTTVRDFESESFYSDYTVFGENCPNATTEVLARAETGNTAKFMHIFTVTDILSESVTNSSSQIWRDSRTNPDVVETIDIVTKYTKVTFGFKLVDQEGKTFANAPAGGINASSSSFSISQNGEVISVPIQVTASNYYRMFEILDNLNRARTLVFKDQSGNYDGEYNIYVEVEAISVDEDSFETPEDAQQDADNYIASFNANNTQYLGASSFTFNTGAREDGNGRYAGDSYTFNLTYGNNSYDLRPGRYTIYVVCEPINYSLTYQTKFVEYNEDGYTKDQFKDESGENAPTISATKVISGEESTTINQGQFELSYDDSISMDTALGENKAYSFYDWYVQGENWEGFLSNIASYDKDDFSFTYNDIYDRLSIGGVSNSITTARRSYGMTLTAVYVRKEVHFTLDEQISIVGEDLNVDPTSYGMEINFVDVRQYDYIYQYGKSPEIEVAFEKTGNSADAYYFVGFNINNSNGDTVQTYKLEDGQIFESQVIDEWILDKMENEDTMAVTTTYSIVPILARKQANIYFLSGTGEGIDGHYTDGRAGKVFDVDENETTDTQVLIQNVNVNDRLYLNGENSAMVGGQLETNVILDEVFASRTGYSLPDNGYWVLSNGTNTWNDINGSTLYITSNYFLGTSDEEILIDLYVYRTWTPNNFNVIFNRNGGTFTGELGGNESITIAVTYDSPLSNILTADDITVTGKQLLGWTIEQDNEATLIFDESGEAQTYVDVIDEDGNYIRADDLNVYALWGSRQYTVRLVTNGANTIAGETAEEFIDFEIYYGDTFAEVFEEYGLTAGDNAPTREGFNFVGVYASGVYVQTITSDTIFNTDIPGCALNEGSGISLTLYIEWEFDEDYLDLQLTNPTLERQYSGLDEVFTLGEFFANGYTANGYIVEVEDDQVSITLDEDVHAQVNVSLTSDNLAVLADSSLRVKNVGSYSANLVLTVEDLISAGTILHTQSLTLYVEIGQASLDVSIERDNETVWLSNVKRIMKSFVSASVQVRIESVSNFDAFVNNVMKSLDSTIPEQPSNSDVYQFVMYKYYQMMTSQNYTLYKEMTYADFAELKQTSQQEIEDLVDMLYFFEFYDDAEETIEIDYYNSAIVMTSESVSNPRSEIAIDRVEIFSESSLNVGASYYFAAYLKNAGSSDCLNNYVLNYNANGEAYVYIGEVYILPELLVVENQSETKAMYYSSNADTISLEWQGDRQSTNDYGINTYYQIGEDLFAFANLYTSNTGKELEDVEFSFVNDENYLYYSDVSIIRRVLENGEYVYYDVTYYFKLILDEDDIFTILNIDGVALVEISARFLTMNDGMIDLTDLPSSVSQELLRITQITYDLEDGQGERRLVNSENGYLQEGMLEVGGYVIAEIEKNNSNIISATLSKFVQTVTIVTTEKDASQYISLYKWTDETLYNIDGTMESNTSYTIEKDEIETAEGEVTTYNMSAIYTDLVYVSYNLNFPSNHTTTSLDYSWLQLGQSTVDDLFLPAEDGFKLATLTAQKPDGTTVSYEELFDSTDGIFRGISNTARHTKVVLDAKWEIDDIQYSQLMTEYKTSVHGFDYLSANSIVTILNLNPDLFTYTYEWFKGDELISMGATFTLESNGVVEDSGQYSLVVTATVKKEFLSTALVSSEGATKSIELSFSLEFIKNKLMGLTFEGEQEFDYDATDHIGDWYIVAEYLVYDSALGDYGTVENYIVEYFNGATNLDFSISFKDEEVSQMRNAGTYIISVSGLDLVYSNAAEFGSETFEVTINPYQVELSESNISFSKYFNTDDQSLTREIFFVETVGLTFERESGEDVGEYEIYLSAVSDSIKENYIFKMNDVVVFENGAQTENGASTSVGTFEILTSGNLRVYYEETEENLQTIETSYSAEGFSIELDGFVLKIYNGSSLFKSIDLNLYDVTLGEDVEDEEILAIIAESFSDVVINFFDTSAHQSVTNSGTYSYSFTNLDGISKYYSDVVFAPGYQFIIGNNAIDVSTMSFDKVYDGETQAYFTISGTKIEDIDSFSGIYISATYANAHVGQTSVSLSLMNKDSGESIANYQLSSQFATANITKLSARLTISMDKQTYEYGEISTNNLNSHISTTYQVEDLEGNDVSDLLVNGYFNITFTLPTETMTNANGFVYKGEYQLQASGSFDDFNMTIVTPSFTIAEKTIEKTISAGQFSILSSENVASSYTETYLLNETGDTINLLYYVVGLTAGQPASIGFYDVALLEDTYVSGSVVFVINTDNDGFAVKAEENLVYIVLDTSILTTQYNGADYVLSVNVSNKTLSVTNGTDIKMGAISFVYADTDLEVEDIILESLEIYYGSSTKNFVNVGTYRLNFSATSATHSNLMFKEEYDFVITEKEIDASKIEIKQTYNGGDNFVITDFEGKVPSDNVSLLAKYASTDVGTEIDVSLYLQGSSASNYVLINAENLKGEIEKANAYVELSQTSFVYGSLTLNLGVPYTVKSDGVVVSSSQYNITLNIAGATYSAIGYLESGTYDVTLDGSSTSANYNLIFDADQTITVSAYSISVVLATSGQYSFVYGSAESKSTTFTGTYLTSLNEYISLTFTREEGIEVGYYKVISAVSNSKNYTVSNTVDGSDGAFRITKANETIYILMSSDAVVSGDTRQVATIVYDGNLYDRVSVAKKTGSDTYQFVFESSENSSATQYYDLNYYSYNIETNEYTLLSDTVIDGLKATLIFANGIGAGNVGEYLIAVQDATADNFMVSLGMYGQQNFYLQIEKRNLYFKEQIVTKVFDNEDAEFDFDDVSEILDGVLAKDLESLSLNIRLTENGAVAKYVGYSYTVEATLFGGDANYTLNLTTSEGIAVIGTITPADITITIDSQAFVYGEDIVLEYTYSTDIDLTYYEKGISINVVPIASDDDYSTSGALKVGEYDAVCVLSSPDFKAVYVVNGEESDVLDQIQITIIKKELSLQGVTEALQEIFTKTYDGSNEVKLQNDDGTSRVNLLGVVSKEQSAGEGEEVSVLTDDVTLVSATYASEYIGQSIEIVFTLSGVDVENYNLTSWNYGVIEAIVVGLNFNYNAEGNNVKSNVENANLQQINILAFPFMSQANLTSNSADTNTTSIRNFPTMLTGKTGNTFVGWTMSFGNIAEGSENYNYLMAVLKNIGMEYTYSADAEEFVVNVGNDADTVELLNSLLQNEADNLGYYYKNHEDISFQFDAVWDINKITVNIKIADEDGEDSTYGVVQLETSSGVSTEITSTYSGTFDYGTRLVLTAKANPHCTYYGFYNATGSIHYDNNVASGVTVSTGEDGVVLTVESLGTAYNFVARFKADEVQVNVDLTDATNATISSSGFVSISQGLYTWNTTYLALEDFTLADIGLSRVGYNVNSFSDGQITISSVDFESTNISDLLSEQQSSITLTPEFEAVGVVVTLDFNDDTTEDIQISVPFGQNYASASGWIETPTYLGHKFEGWYDSFSGEIVTGQTVLTTTDSRTLTATWSKEKYSVTITTENADITSEVLTGAENVYTATEVEFDSSVSFKVTPKAGYTLENAEEWNENFQITPEDDGSVTVNFKMPAGNIECQIVATAVKNNVTISGDHLGEILAYDVTGEETPIDFEGTTIPIETGKVLKLVVSATYGFQMTDEVSCDDENVSILREVSGGVLTLTISNIVGDINITLNTIETINDVTIKFSDSSVIEDLIVGGVNYRDFANLAPFQVNTGDELEMYLKFVHGFEYDSYFTDGEFEVVSALATEGDFATEGYYKVVVSNVTDDGEITLTSKLSKFTLNFVVRSFDENKVEVTEPENKILVDGEEVGAEIEADFGSTVTLTYSMSDIYSFAGWSKDGVNVFSMESELEYEISDNETIYAIFSSMIFNIRFSTYNYYVLNSEYGDPSAERIVYQEIAGRGESFVDVDTNQTISSLELYFGSSKTLRYTVPTGYRYYGIGYRDGNDFVMLEIDETSSRTVEFTLSSLTLDEDLANLTIYAVVRAYSFDININTAVDIDSVREPNEDVGGVRLQSSSGEETNQYGYVDGTRVHYSENDFVDGSLVDDRQFTVVGYTGEDVYIRVDVKKAGYRFYDIVSNTDSVTLSEVERGENYVIYVIRGAVGGTTIDIDVLFRPNLNNIKIGFKYAENDVNGGAITYAVDSENANKVWASGRDYSSITVAGYTDSFFEVYVYVKLGYYVDPSNLEILCADDIIDRDSIEYTALSVEDGYTGRIKFVVKDYLQASEIYITLKAYSYTVKLVEDGETLVVIRNVEFGSRMNLYQQNQDNIEISETEERIMFVDGKLAFNMQRENYNFEGFFTSENGVGVRYIDGNGDVVLEWDESGYRQNTITSKYELTENAFFNTETGEMEITLYLYWSYYKTRISFELVPNANFNVTAQDMVTGVDYANSWFYPTSPMYIEVAFNTNIYIVAPELSGYKFYKFIIQQRDIDGNWLEEVVTFSDEVPWSTNESDKIVEVNIQVVYFAMIEVVVYGGEGSFTIVQDSSDAQAVALVEQNYVDTTKPFDLVAVFDENNFEFVRWNNLTNGQSWAGQTWAGLMIDSKTTLIMNIQGKTFVISFADEADQMYDYTFGRILSVMTESADGTSRAYSLGSYVANNFTPTRTEVEARVGDKVTFVLSIDYGFAVVWNRDDITFANYTGGLYYFEMTVGDCPPDSLMRILPEFENEIVSIYINRDFIESDIEENTIDMNSVSMAGYTTYNGTRTDFVSSAYNVESILIGLVTNDRYGVASIVVRNYEKEFRNVSDFTDEDGNIIFTKEFLEGNGIVGVIQIDIKYQRLHWEDESYVGLLFEGEGTDDDPFRISSAEELALMMQLCNSGATYGNGKMYRSASYILTDDIVLSERFWTPIGTVEYSFNGYFNFNNHTVTGIYNAYYYDTVSYGGLFGVLSPNAVIVMRVENLWYVYLIVGIVVILIVILVTSILVSRKKKKARQRLANK